MDEHPGQSAIVAAPFAGHAPRATPREWIGLAVIALPCLLYAMVLTVLNLALPRLSAELRPSSAQLLWIVDIYGFFVAGMLVTMGNLGGPIRAAMATAALDGVPPDARAAASDTLGGATAAAAQLSAQAGARLLETARLAFAQALQVTVAVCAIISALTAVLVVVTLRRIRPPAAAAE